MDEETEAQYYESIETVSDYASYFRYDKSETGKAVWRAILAHEKRIGAWQ